MSHTKTLLFLILVVGLLPPIPLSAQPTMATHEELWLWAHEKRQPEISWYRIQWSPDGQHIAVLASEHVWLYSSTVEPLVQLPLEPGYQANDLTWSGNSQRLGIFAINSRELSARVDFWDTSRFPPTHLSTLSGDFILSARIKMNPAGTLLALPIDQYIVIWSTITLEQVCIVRAHKSAPVTEVNWSPDGSLIVAGLAFGEIAIWETTTFDEVSRLEYSEAITSVVWNPAGDQLAVGLGGIREIRILDYDVATGMLEPVQTLHEGRTTSIALNWQGNRLASARDGNYIQVWDTTSWTSIDRFSGALAVEFAPALSPDGSKLALINREGVLTVVRPGVTPEPADAANDQAR